MPDHALESINAFEVFKFEPFVEVIPHTHGHKVGKYPLVFQLKFAQTITDLGSGKQVLESTTKIGGRL